MSNPIPAEVAQQIANCIYAGQQLQAIKLYRDSSGQGLKESKDFIELLAVELRGKDPQKFTQTPAGKGCMGMAAALSLGPLAAMAAWAL